MKKIALFVSVLLLTGSLFAADPVFEAKPGISGDATLTFGVNLDGTVATGFANASSTNLTLGLVNKDSNEKGGKDGEEVYGWIKLKDFEMKVDGSLTISKPGIEAKLFLGPVYINILGTDKNVDKAGNIQESTIGKTVSLAQNQSDEFEGIAIGLKDTAVVDVVLGVSSAFDWLATAAGATTYVWAAPTTATQTVPVATAVAGAAANSANTANVYNFYVAAALKAVPGLTAELAANLTTATGGTVGAGVKVGYDIAVAEGIKITPSVGFDMAYGTALAYQLTGDVFVSFPGAKKKFTMQKAEIEYSPGFEVKYTMGSATGNPMDLGVYLWDANLIPVLDLFAAFEIAGLGSAGQLMGLGLNASATIDVISPFAKFMYAQSTATVASTKLEVGVDIKAITNTTFTLKYASGDLSAATTGLGIITFATKIAY